MDFKLGQIYETNRDHGITALSGHNIRMEVINLMAGDKEQPITLEQHSTNPRWHGVHWNITKKGVCLAGGKSEPGVEIFHLVRKIDCNPPK